MTVDIWAQILWDYQFLQMQPEKADFILVPGSHDPDTAVYAAELWLQGLAPIIVTSGKPLHNWPEHGFDQPVSEAEGLALIAQKNGVPGDKILREDRATNTAENFLFTRELLAEHGLPAETALIVQKPYFLRRLQATQPIRWPELQATYLSRPINFDDYIKCMNKNKVINHMVGDLQRIMEYPANGWMAPQAEPIPQNVIDAYHNLLAAGYDRYTIGKPYV